MEIVTYGKSEELLRYSFDIKESAFLIKSSQADMIDEPAVLILDSAAKKSEVKKADRRLQDLKARLDLESKARSSFEKYTNEIKEALLKAKRHCDHLQKNSDD